MISRHYIRNPYARIMKPVVLRCSRCLCVMTEQREILSKLEDLKVLRRSPDLLNNCKTGQGQLHLIMKHILFYHIWGLQPFWSNNLNNLTAQ